MKSKVKELLDEKGSHVETINVNDTVYNGLVMMSKKDIGALMVVDDNGKLVGIFSERDYARKIVLMGKSSKETKVGDMMSKEITVVRLDNSIQECLHLMTIKKVRHLPVLQDHDLVGIISIGDAVNRVISDQEATIHDLEDYIYGRAYGAQIELNK
jgi:CBS domain-containing protein